MNAIGIAFRRETRAALCSPALFCLLGLWPVFAQGQTPTGQIHLEVKDPSGAALVATGKLASVAPGPTRSFQTDAQGAYSFDGLTLGLYRSEERRVGKECRSRWSPYH